MKIQIIKYLEGYLGIKPEKTQVELNKLYYESDNNIPVYSFTKETLPKNYFLKEVLFCSKELDLDLLTLPDWREFEVEQLAYKQAQIKFKLQHIPLYQIDEYGGEIKSYVDNFIAGYNHNKAKYTEEDLELAINKARYGTVSNQIRSWQWTKKEIIQSLQKLPKYIVMESEILSNKNIWKEILLPSEWEIDAEIRPKLITNSEGKQEGIIKEIL